MKVLHLALIYFRRRVIYALTKFLLGLSARSREISAFMLLACTTTKLNNANKKSLIKSCQTIRVCEKASSQSSPNCNNIP